MPEKPLLILPTYEKVGRPKGSPGRDNIHFPDRWRQVERLRPQFDRLQRTLNSEALGLLHEDPSSIAPDRAVVFEVAGSIDDFYGAVRRIDGLEFLVDEEIEFEPDGDFYEIDQRIGAEADQRRDDRFVGGRLYLAMPNEAALKKLVNLWERWQETGELERGFASWRNIFNSLKTIRPWGRQDRISRETIENWEEKIELDQSKIVKIEVELWFCENSGKRSKNFNDLSNIVKNHGGHLCWRS